MKKRRLSLSVGVDEAENLARLPGLASALVSRLLAEFFRRHAIEELWTATGMDKPLSEAERIERLDRFIEACFSSPPPGSPAPSENKNPGKKRNYWGWSR
jgi:hypothetical protein